jgi:hypothetical protein
LNDNSVNDDTLHQVSTNSLSIWKSVMNSSTVGLDKFKTGIHVFIVALLWLFILLFLGSIQLIIAIGYDLTHNISDFNHIIIIIKEGFVIFLATAIISAIYLDHVFDPLHKEIKNENREIHSNTTNYWINWYAITSTLPPVLVITSSVVLYFCLLQGVDMSIKTNITLQIIIVSFAAFHAFCEKCSQLWRNNQWLKKLSK